MKQIVIAGALALALCVAPSIAGAAPFTGQVDYTGVHTPDNGNLTLATQTVINFNFVVISNGAFAAAGINMLDPLVHVSPFQFRPFGGPYNPLWSHAGSGVSFRLDTLSIVSDFPNQLGLSGTGVFSGAGYDDTPGIWNMTLNNTTQMVTGSFSSSSSVVPEPAMLALLGFGLVGVARRYRRQ